MVDEALYLHPPSLLIGTIDKFARVAWDERTGALFGVGTGSRPPELVIQDELHLITGPLGSVAGLYEAGLETLLVRRGVRPKYVASTATIRMAAEQVRRLYARDLAVFPPPGLSHDDSYFAGPTGSVRGGSMSATSLPCSISSTASRRLPAPCSPGRKQCSMRTRIGTSCSMRGGPR